METETREIPSGTRCDTCRHPYSFHPDGGPCKARMCAKGCRRFAYPPGKPLLPNPIDQQRLTQALDDLVSAIQRAPKRTRFAAAVKLDQIIENIPALRKAAHAADRPLRQILDNCRRPTPAPKDAEVAPDDAPDTPGRPA